MGPVHPNFGSEGRGFESLRACHSIPRRHRLFVHWPRGLSVEADDQLVPFWCHVATNAWSGWGSPAGTGPAPERALLQKHREITDDWGISRRHPPTGPNGVRLTPRGQRKGELLTDH